MFFATHLSFPPFLDFLQPSSFCTLSSPAPPLPLLLRGTHHTLTELHPLAERHDRRQAISSRAIPSCHYPAYRRDGERCCREGRGEVQGVHFALLQRARGRAGPGGDAVCRPLPPVEPRRTRPSVSSTLYACCWTADSLAYPRRWVYLPQTTANQQK